MEVNVDYGSIEIISNVKVVNNEANPEIERREVNKKAGIVIGNSVQNQRSRKEVNDIVSISIGILHPNRHRMV